jgi:4-hydroxy-tetrahydrodipicolinate reductase
MGRAIRAALPDAPGIFLRACVAHGPAEGALPEGCLWLSPEELAKPGALEALPADLVIVDVSLAAGTAQLLSVLERTPRALVAATTGLDLAAEGRVESLASKVAVLRARNLSLGNAVVAALLRALPAAARDAFDADVVEHHHAGKRDAPSGTAIHLATALGPIGSPRRPDRDVRFHSIRGGTEPGTHRVVLSGEGETVTIEHTVHDRSVFARGALRAAAYVHGKPAGLYPFESALT